MTRLWRVTARCLLHFSTAAHSHTHTHEYINSKEEMHEKHVGLLVCFLPVLFDKGTQSNNLILLRFNPLAFFPGTENSKKGYQMMTLTLNL